MRAEEWNDVGRHAWQGGILRTRADLMRLATVIRAIFIRAMWGYTALMEAGRDTTAGTAVGITDATDTITEA